MKRRSSEKEAYGHKFYWKNTNPLTEEVIMTIGTPFDSGYVSAKSHANTFFDEISDSNEEKQNSNTNNRDYRMKDLFIKDIEAEKERRKELA